MIPQLKLTASTDTSFHEINGFRFEHQDPDIGALTIATETFYEVIFNCGGVINYRYDHGAAVCGSGNILCILSPGSIKQFILETPAKLLRLYIKPEFMQEWFGNEKIDFVSEGDIKSPLITQLMTSLSIEVSRSAIIERRYTMSIAMAVVNELYCQFRASGKKSFSPKGKLSAHQMKKIIDLVKSLLHSDIHLSTMASEVHLSEFHFSRLFRNTFGISPYQYVLQVKVEYAKTLLRNYPRSLSQIAHSLNFTDQSHFTNVFKKLTGICPSDFAMNRIKSVA